MPLIFPISSQLWVKRSSDAGLNRPELLQRCGFPWPVCACLSWCLYTAGLMPSRWRKTWWMARWPELTRVKCADGRAMFLKCIASLLKPSNGWNWYMQWFLWVRWLVARCHFSTLDHRCTWVIFIWIWWSLTCGGRAATPQGRHAQKVPWGHWEFGLWGTTTTQAQHRHCGEPRWNAILTDAEVGLSREFFEIGVRCDLRRCI